MALLDWRERPYVEVDAMASYSAIDADVASKFGLIVRAAEISNRDYGYRFNKFSSSRTMQPSPSAVRHIILGFLVVRKLGMPDQYETWMPDHVIEELYELPS